MRISAIKAALLAAAVLSPAATVIAQEDTPLTRGAEAEVIARVNPDLIDRPPRPIQSYGNPSCKDPDWHMCMCQYDWRLCVDRAQVADEWFDYDRVRDECKTATDALWRRYPGNGPLEWGQEPFAEYIEGNNAGLVQPVEDAAYFNTLARREMHVTFTCDYNLTSMKVLRVLPEFD
jgi:hypothetical protein